MTDGPPRVWRLLVHEPADGGWNMAVDEALLESCAALRWTTPTLRLYGWSPAALSLGRNQAAEEAHDPAELRRRGIDLVRRPTGGQAVLHDDERTYSVIGPAESGPLRGGILEAYLRIAEALADALRELGLEPSLGARRDGPAHAAGPSCFELASTHEIQVDGRKLVGSAQLRRRGALLQHGSIPLDLDPSTLGSVIGHPASGVRFTDFTAALGRRVDPSRLDDALICAFERRFDVRLEPGALTPHEALRAEQLRCWKYDSIAWTHRGRIGKRERCWGPI